MGCRRLSIVLFIGILACALTACNPGLDGDLSVRIEGPSGLEVGYSRSLRWVEGEFSIGGTITIPDGGTWTKDLKTNDVELRAVRITASTSSEEGLTLQLLRDGEVFKEDTEPEQQDGDNLYAVEVWGTDWFVLPVEG